MRGWLAEIKRAKSSRAQIPYYVEFGQLLTYFYDWIVLPFDAAAVERYEELRRLRLRSIGTQDLKIAAIALCHNATLLSANLQHFRLVPGLSVADWLHTPV